ncbi:hypothetical protein BJV77DRAFT_1023886 [Russula vinacea]|nr:hypothetical protein BJV77DRAFT_1023886 [Russula vinacea]
MKMLRVLAKTPRPISDNLSGKLFLQPPPLPLRMYRTVGCHKGAVVIPHWDILGPENREPGTNLPTLRRTHVAKELRIYSPPTGSIALLLYRHLSRTDQVSTCFQATLKNRSEAFGEETGSSPEVSVLALLSSYQTPVDEHTLTTPFIDTILAQRILTTPVKLERATNVSRYPQSTRPLLGTHPLLRLLHSCLHATMGLMHLQAIIWLPVTVVWALRNMPS